MGSMFKLAQQMEPEPNPAVHARPRVVWLSSRPPGTAACFPLKRRFVRFFAKFLKGQNPGSQPESVHEKKPGCWGGVGVGGHRDEPAACKHRGPPGPTQT